MAEQKEILLYEVSFDPKTAKEKAEGLRATLGRLRIEKSALEKDFKAGAVSADEYGKSIQAIETATRQTTQQLKETNKELELNENRQNAANGSIKQMRATLISLNTTYDSLSKSERENANTGVLLQKNIASLTDELKELEKETGRSQRNVGNYVREFNVLGVNVGQAEEAFKGGLQGVQVFTKGIMTGRGALIAFAAVPIIALLVGLISFLKSTDEGMGKLAQGVAFVTEAFDALLKGLAPIGKLLVDTFTDPLGTLKKLVAGTNEYSVSLDEVAANAVKAGLANAAYTKTMQDVEAAENALIVQRAKVGLQVDLALLKVKDRSLSERQRLNVLRDAGKAEADLARATVKNTTDSFNAIVKLNQVRAQSRQLTDDEKKAQDEAQAAVINAQRESLATQQQIQNRSSALIEKEQSDQKASADKATAAQKKAAEDRKSLAEVELIRARRNGEDTLTIEERILRLSADAENIGLSKKSAQRKLNEAKVNLEILGLRTKHVSELEQLEFLRGEGVISARIALAKKSSEAEFNLKNQLLQAQLLKEKSVAVDAAEADAKLRAGLVAKLRLIDAKFTSDSEALQKDFDTAQIDRVTEFGKIRAQTDLDLSNQSLAATIAYQNKLIDLEEKHSIDILNLADETETDRLAKLNAIQAKAIAARKVLEAQELEQERKNGIARTEVRIIQSVEGSRKELEAKKDLLKKQLALELENLKLTEDEKAKIRAEYRNREETLDGEFSQKLAANIINSVSAASGALSKLYDAQTSSQNAALEKAQGAALKSAGLSAEQRQRIEENFAAKKEKLDKQAAEKRKRIATIENIIAIARGITESIKLPFPFNIIQGALVVATGAAQQAVISAQQFASGGFVSDGRGNSVIGAGTGLSDSIPARLSNGESVINAKSTAMFKPLLSWINQLGGGRDFAGQSATSTLPQNFAFGGIASPSSVTQTTGNQTAQLAQMTGEIITKALSQLPPSYVAVSEFKSVNARINKVEVRSDK